MTEKKAPLDLSGLEIRDACEKISKHFLDNIPNWLDELAVENPKEAIKAWEMITEFAEAKKPRESGNITAKTINIQMNPVERKQIE